jgi:phospholipase/carboxylesterase
MAQSDKADLGYIHRFVPAQEEGRAPLLLLHGTGGDESDLLPLGERLAPGASLLSPRGKVLEHGMPRFFRRSADGIFDLDDLKRRTGELADFVAAARTAYAIEKPVAVGFSNGANIAAAMLLMRHEELAGAVLMRATVPFIPERLPDLSAVPILMLSGATDPMVTADKRDRLARLLAAAGAVLDHEVVPAGHGLSAQDIGLASAWLARHG